MLIRHIFSYLVARGLPGIVNFVALAIYTRLLAADEFGRYSVIVASVGLVQVVAFEWLALICGRFVPAHANNPKIVLQPVLALFLWLAGAGALFTVLVTWAWVPESWRILILIATALTVVQAWNALNLKYFAAQLQPGLYGAMSAIAAVSALGVGSALALAGWGASAPLLGLTLGALAAWLLVGRRPWSGVRPRLPDVMQARAFAQYGLPLAAVFSLLWVTSSSDRLMITAFLGASQTGLYAVGYDLAQQTLILLLSIVNTAATPLAIKLLESGGVDAAREQMRQNGQIMFALAFSGAAGLIAIGPAMIELFVGAEFRAGALTVFPWIAASAGIVGLKAYYFDIAFHLSRKSWWLLITSGLAAIVNIGLNFIFIPTFGIVGAAWAAIISYLLAAATSFALGRYVFAMPNVLPLLAHGVFCGSAVYASAYLCMQTELAMAYRMIVAILMGGVAAFIVFLLLNTADLRSILLTKMTGYFR